MPEARMESKDRATIPHFVVHIAVLLTLGFLLLEARRLTFYHLWQQRVLLLERGWIRPALSLRADDAALTQLATELDPHLGTTVPTMSLWKATARRLRRIYLYLFAVQLLAWGLKLASHPAIAWRAEDLIARAGIGAVPGGATIGVAGVSFLALIVVAFALGGVERPRD